MTMKKLIALTLSLFLAAATGCSQYRQKPELAEPLTVSTSQEVTGKDPDEVFALGQTKFALELLQETVSANAGENVVLSPYSMMQTLAMTAEGAAGETKTEMEQMLGGETDQLRQYLYTFRTEQSDNLLTANSVWLADRDDLTVEESFLSDLTYYDASVFQEDFHQDVVKSVNRWVENRTQGNIPQLLEEIDPNAVMLLVNATSFQAKWRTPYPKNDVFTGTFYAASGKESSVEMMESMESAYIKDEHAEGFVKPYEEDYAFVAILPEGDLSQYVQELTLERLRNLLTNPEAEAVEVTLPKFSCEFGGEMQPQLSEMGMTQAFSSEKADFSAMAHTGNPLFVGSVVQKCKIDVYEEGTSAHAAAAAEVDESAACEKNICLNRPFLYGIVELETGLPIFLGVYNEVE